MIKLRHILENYTNDYRVSADTTFREYIKRVEGEQLTAYDLGDGMITIGYGHAEPKSKSKYKVGQTISKSEAEQLLTQDIKTAESRVNAYMQTNFPNVALTLLQKQMLTDYAFNPGLTEFPKFVRAVVARDWKTATREYKRYFQGRELGRNQIFYDTFLTHVDGQTAPQVINVTISPNQATPGEQVTISIGNQHLPLNQVKLAIMSIGVGARVVKNHMWNQVKMGILKFNAPETPGTYQLVIYAPNTRFWIRLPLMVK